MNLKFGKDKTVNEVDLETLEATRDFTAFGRSKKHPIHYKVINQIIKMVKERLRGSQYTIKLSKLWISPKGGIHLSDNPHPEHPSSFLIERAYCRIDLNHITDSDKNMAIGVLFNEKGYNLAYGVNVRECTNFTVYGEHFHSTYGGDKKANHEAIMELLHKWLNEIDIRRVWYYKLVEALQSIQITGERVKEICGDLLQRAVARNRGYKKEENSGLNQTQVADFAHKAWENRENVSVTAWEMLNWGTELLKPESSDLADLQNDICDFNNFFISHYAGLSPDMFGQITAELKQLELNQPEEHGNETSDDSTTDLEGQGDRDSDREPS